MSKILVFSPDRVGKEMAGPGVRYWNFAIQLAKKHDVTLLVKNEDYLSGIGFKVLQVNEVKLKKKLFFTGFDVIIIQGMALLEYPILKKIKVPLVIDLYDPFIFEILAKDSFDHKNEKLYSYQLHVLLEQIEYGDYFICASEKQKDFWLGMLAAVVRINPESFRTDASFRSMIGVVPFGLPEEEPIKTRPAIREDIPEIHTGDKVVLWWGGLWDWLDPKTLIEAMNIVSQFDSGIKCVIVGTKHPDPNFIAHEIVNEVQALSKSYKLTGSSVFFVEWVAFEDRMNYLLDSDIGISLHFNTLETRFSFRTRIMDYLWSKLPMIVNDGDILAEIVEKHHLGQVVDQGDYKELANKIIDLCNESINLKSFEEVQRNFYWSEVTKELERFCDSPKISSSKNVAAKSVKVKKPNKAYIYFSKSIQLIGKGDIPHLIRKIKQKINKR